MIELNNSLENEKQSYTKFFNIYIYTISNLLSIILYYIEKIRSKKKKKENDGNILKTKSTIELIYDDGSPVKMNKLIIRLIFITLTDLSAQYFVFIFYLFIVVGKVQLDSLLIFNISFKYLFSRIILKTNYYKHHHLSFIINIICLILISITDILSIYENWEINIIYFILIKIFCTICYSLEDVIVKKSLI